MSYRNSRTEKRNKTIIFILALVCIFVIAICIIWFLYMNSKNYVVDGISSLPVETKATDNYDIILIEDLLLGGVSGNKFVDAKTMYSVIASKKNLPIYMYDMYSKVGEFETASFKSKSDLIYTTTTKQPTPKYIAVGIQNTKSSIINFSEKTVDKKDEKIVRKALGKYKWLNRSVKINEAYEVPLTEENIGSLYFVTSKSKGLSGIYSAVIYTNGINTYLIKYNYVKDTARAADWPIYNLKYILDINADGNSEMIIQETKENSAKYIVISYDGKEFNEVLNLEFWK